MSNPNSCVVNVAEMEARLTPVEATAVATAVRDEPTGEWRVKVTFISETAVDREGGYGWHLRPNHARLADRLVHAVNAGAVFSDYRMGTDINGKTYITAKSNILSRMMNADLNRLGF